MPTRPFDNPNFATPAARPFSPSFQMSSYAAPLTRPGVLEAGRIRHNAELHDDAVVDISRLGKGVCWALAIEGAATLCIFLAWHLYSLL